MNVYTKSERKAAEFIGVPLPVFIQGGRQSVLMTFIVPRCWLSTS